MLRGEILTALAMFGHEETLTEANRRFHAFLNDRNTPLFPPDIRKVVHCEELVEAIHLLFYPPVN